MTDAYDKAQIEQLDMRLSQMIDDCALMKVEIGLLRAGRPPFEIKINNPIQPAVECHHVYVTDSGSTNATPKCIKCGRIYVEHPGESWQTEDVQPLFDSAGFWVCDRLVTL